MTHVISAQALKRRGISALDTALREGPVHVTRRDHPGYVILSQEAYRNLVGNNEAPERLWDRLLTGQPSGTRSFRDIDEQLYIERRCWGHRQWRFPTRA